MEREALKCDSQDLTLHTVLSDEVAENQAKPWSLKQNQAVRLAAASSYYSENVPSFGSEVCQLFFQRGHFQMQLFSGEFSFAS
jgi:hypothetical protein